MNSPLKPALILFALLAAPFASAQVTLQDFTAFQSDTNTFFFGDWELHGDTGGSSSPRASFSQGIGVYNFAGGNNDQTSAVQYFFDTPLNITGLTLLQVSAMLLPGNTASSFDVTLFDQDGGSALATFATTGFAGPGFHTVSTTLNLAGFNPTELTSFQLSGNNVFGPSQTLSVSLDRLAVSAPVSAVPEPATYGLFAALALFALASFRRLRGTDAGSLRVVEC